MSTAAGDKNSNYEELNDSTGRTYTVVKTGLSVNTGCAKKVTPLSTTSI